MACPHGLQKPFKNAQLHGGWTKMKNSPAVQPDDAMRRFEVTVNINRLIEIKLAVMPPAERVDNMMRVLGAKTRKHHPARHGFSAQRRRFEKKQFRALPDITTAVARHHTRRNQKAVGEDGGLVRLSVSVQILEDQNFVIRLSVQAESADKPRNWRPRGGPRNRSSSGSAWPDAGSRRTD